ncbi:MAG: serine/threonine-protein kinase [Candidatus Melainabacteria bacterium]|nr:serine/threonine-protein kinase [Candidatus Melainabacteria bacterium]
MSSKSDNVQSKKNRKGPKIKLADAPERQKIELTVEDAPIVDVDLTVEDTPEKSLPEISATQALSNAPENEEATASESLVTEEITAAQVTPTPEVTARAEQLPPLPNLGIGILTATVSILAFLLIPSELNTRVAPYHPSTLASFLTGIVFYVLHLVWFFTSQKQLIKNTVPLLPQCAKGANTRTALLSLLPLSWLTLIGYYFSQLMFLSAYSVLQVLPWLLLVSLVYFVAALSYWPSKLKTLCSEQQKRDFPNKFRAVFLGCFMTVPYIWYWRKALITVNQTDKAGTFKLQTKVIDRDKMVIRYRPFIAIERWFKHRHKTTSRKDRIINASIALTINLALLIIFCTNFPDIAAAIGRLLDPNGPGSQGGSQVAANIFRISNQTFLALIGVLSASFTVAASYFVLKQPTNYEFTPLGFKSFRWLGAKKVESELVPWNSLTSIELNTKNKRGQTTASELQFNRNNGVPVKLSMGAIESVEDREIILDAIERWAPGVSRSAALVQALQPPVDHSYTEMWLQALSAPPQRDRLQPLTEDIVLNEGRYRVKRSLGVGGQGAAYSAYDHASGDTVVLKEFLLPIYVDISVRKDVLESFESEARILKHLNHNQVVKLNDFFVEDHRAYLVLEHIDGKSLREIVAKEGPLPEERVRELTRQMCAILSYLHSQEPQVVHRDFTPENLILRNDGILKLIDFNVARQVESNATGSVVGKPAYLPPEQFRGQPVSQSDIYGMGATLSFLLTGKEPEPISVAHPREENRTVSRSMDKIVAKATAINLKDRYANCDQIIEDLDAPASANDDNNSDDHSDRNGNNNGNDSTKHSNNNDGSNGHAASIPTPSPAPTADDKETPTELLKELLRENTKAPFSTAAQFKLNESTADNITLKVVDSANLVSKGQLALSPLQGDGYEKAGSSESLASDPSSLSQYDYQSDQNSNQVKPTNSLPLSLDSAKSMTGLWTGILALVGVFTSWLVITIAVAWALIPGSPAWLDSKAALHNHGHAAMVAFFNQNGDKALEECNKCIEIDPNCALAYFGRGLSHSIHKDVGYCLTKETSEKGLPDFKKAVELAPTDYAMQTTYGVALSETGHYQEAESALKKSVVLEHSAIVPGIIEQLMQPRKRYQERRKYEIAKAQLFQMNYQDATAFYDSLKAKGNYGYGCETTEQIIAYELAHQPQEALTRSARPMQYFKTREGDKQSLFPIMMHRAALERAIATTNKDSSAQPGMNLFYDGLGLHGLGRYEQAVEKLSQAINLKPGYIDYYLFRGSCYRYLHKYDLALVDFQTALQLQPTNEYAQYMKQQVLENISGKSEPKTMNWRELE